MRKLFLFVMAAMWAASMWAVPVRPGLYRMEKQPDGTEVKVFIHGDEWFNYETDSLDNVFERDTKGHLYILVNDRTYDATGRLVK